MTFLSASARDILARALWTFVQAAIAVILLDLTKLYESGTWKAAAIAGLAATLSFVKSLSITAIKPKPLDSVAEAEQGVQQVAVAVDTDALTTSPGQGIETAPPLVSIEPPPAPASVMYVTTVQGDGDEGGVVSWTPVAEAVRYEVRYWDEFVGSVSAPDAALDLTTVLHPFVIDELDPSGIEVLTVDAAGVFSSAARVTP